jgi:ribose 5-phosphate isomerase A
LTNNSEIISHFTWSTTIQNLEAKTTIAQHLAGEVKNGDVVGVGSGSTSYLALQAIGERVKQESLRCLAVPTSHEVGIACAKAGIPTTTLWEHHPDWCFDGADEVDGACNLIKGRGGAMFKEKLVMRASPRIYILADPSKLVERLGGRFPIPVEVYPSALTVVESGLAALGAEQITLRLAVNKDGPEITENGNLILDARFPEILYGLEKEIKQITGVIESGLFIGFPVELLVA